MSRTQCFERYSRFKTGRTSIDEDPRSERPSMSTDVVFFDWQGAVHYEFVPRGQTVNKEFYVAVLKRLSEAVC